MKILTCNPDGGAFKYILTGVQTALKLAGNEVAAVQGKAVPTDFDLYLGCSGWRQQIPPKDQRRGKVGIHVNPYGVKKVGGFPLGPVIDESQEAINWTVAQKPDFVYCYCSDTFTPEYFGYYTSKHGIPVVGLPTAADITVYKPFAAEDRYKCDVAWVGGKWPYKAVMMDQYLPPLFSNKCQIFGWGNTWRNNQAINDSDVPRLFSSAKICPSVSETHTAHHPVDVPERVFKVPAAGGFTIHTPTPAGTDLWGDTIPMAKDVKHWVELHNFYLSHDAERTALAKKQRELILARHTYFDRCAGIARVLGDQGLNDRLMAAKQAVISQPVA